MGKYIFSLGKVGLWEPARPIIWPLILGLVIFVIVTSIPIFGWVIKLAAIWWALGAFFQVKKETLKEYR